MITVAIAATQHYLYAWPACIRAVAAAALHHEEGHLILATDQSDAGKQAIECARGTLPEGWTITGLHLDVGDDTSENYKEAAQLRIARLQGAAFALARKMRAWSVWSVESDNIVSADALRVLEWTLSMPTADGQPYYDIAAATYPNGLFLGGFGSPRSPIAEDFADHERQLPERLKLALAACEARIAGLTKYQVVRHTCCKCGHRAVIEMQGDGGTFGGPAALCTKCGSYMQPVDHEHEAKRMARLRARVRRCPPAGNIWEVTAKHGYRRRGWMEYAYPGIGRGAVVPSDWCGLGCTLLSHRALALADFTGYAGHGTQDLFLCWQRWSPAGLRIACVPHVVCDHIKRRANGIEHLIAYHEQEGECRGHLRVRSQHWVPL